MACHARELVLGCVVLVLAFFADLTTCNKNAKNTLSIQPVHSEMILLINESYMVACYGNNNEKVRWMSPKGEVVADSKGRLHVESRKDLPSGAQALVFEHVAKADKGEWSCHADNQNYTKSLNMTVYERISFVDTDDVQVAREDKEGKITCSVRGDPTPTVNWYFNGMPLNMSNPKYRLTDKGLTIKKVSLEDKGNFTCQALQLSKYANDVMDKVIKLNIQHKPIAPKHARAEIAYGYISGTVNLTCEALAEPAANFTWHFNGGPVSKNTGRIFEDTHVSVLVVPINDEKAFADYKCVAKNFVGTMERIITLTQGQRPKPPSEILLRGANWETLDIDIKDPRPPESSSIAPRADNLPIIGYRFQYMPAPVVPNNEVPKYIVGDITSNDVEMKTSTTELPEEIDEDLWKNATEKDFDIEDGATYILTHLEQNTEYAVRVMARNPAGLSFPSLTRRYRTLILQPQGVLSGASSVYPSFAFIFVLIGVNVLTSSHFIMHTKRRQNALLAE
ncbi:neural cell adhesion molecule 1-A-like [Arctopsyche grandis]|uniref:neural cell adhesion molecule 1-A-like n=1 Tax=Arctopsyche grandis TaxID=121162 RepID=UPI00406D8E95